MAQPYYDIRRWEASTEYSYGELIAPAVDNDHVYICAYPGISDVSSPVFPTDAGEIVYDGDITWKEYNPTDVTFKGAFHPVYGIAYNDYERKLKYVQDVQYTEGGYVYVYNRGLQRETRTIRYNIMSASDLLLLLDFVAIVRGAAHFFIFVDENAVEHKAIFLNADDIVSVPTTYNLEGRVVLELMFLPS